MGSNKITEDEKESMMSAKKFHYLRCCVDFPQHEVEHLIQMIDDATDITYKTFFRHVSWREVSGMFEYELRPENGLTPKNDFHVSYHRSKINGTPCYFVKHSAIEYIFVPETQYKEFAS